MKTAGVKELNIILKGDVHGSIEVLSDLLGKMSNDKVRLKVLRSGVGAITESDVLLGVGVERDRPSGSMFDQSAKHKNLPSRKKLIFACTRSFTNCRTRSSAL